MSDSQAEPERTWTTDFVERSIKQPVREAVREALAEHDTITIEDADDGDATDATEDADVSGETDETAADTDDGDDAASSRPSAVRFLLLVGGLAGVAYAVTRHRSGDDSSDDESSDAGGEPTEIDGSDGSDDLDASDETEGDTVTETDSDDPIRDGERPTAPAEDAAAN